MPFLWVAPLSLYLLTFIIAFDHARWYRPVLFSALTLVTIYCVAVGYSSGLSDIKVFGCGTLGNVWRAICSEWSFWHGVEEELLSPMISIKFMQYVGL